MSDEFITPANVPAAESAAAESSPAFAAPRASTQGLRRGGVHKWRIMVVVKGKVKI